MLYLEQCCHHRDWLLMAMLPNVSNNPVKSTHARACSAHATHSHPAVPTHTTRVWVCTCSQAIGAVAYTALRDLGVLMKTQYGRTDVAPPPARRHGPGSIGSPAARHGGPAFVCGRSLAVVFIFL